MDLENDEDSQESDIDARDEEEEDRTTPLAGDSGLMATTSSSIMLSL
jgi:hypothetical protein